MTDVRAPDYADTPAAACRPAFHYQPREPSTPVVSIVSLCDGAGPLTWETLLSLQRMSFARWEWLVLHAGATDATSGALLARMEAEEPRMRVISQQPDAAEAAACAGVTAARGRYVVRLGGSDLLEPTFVEKAVWVLETQPEIDACGAHVVAFGEGHGHGMRGSRMRVAHATDGIAPSHLLMRREAALARLGAGHASKTTPVARPAAYTIPERLIWHCVSAVPGHSGNEGTGRSASPHRRSQGMRVKGFDPWAGLIEPSQIQRLGPSSGRIEVVSPVSNPLGKRENTRRVLLILPWLQMGGADKFNLDLIRSLSRRGYEFTVATTLGDDDPWLSQFTHITPDVFRLPQFLAFSDYPRFLNELVESRQADAVIISHSEWGYALAPFLRALHPRLALLDYNHLEEEEWLDGGYPRLAVRAGCQLDLNVTCTEHLKRWMVARGADPERIQVCHCNVDTREWSLDAYDTAAIRERLGVAPGTPILLFAGRMVAQKRPEMLGAIVKRLAAIEPNFVCFVAGAGPELPALRRFVRSQGLRRQVRILGAVSPAVVRELMAAGDIFLLPSEREGLALVLYESMALEMVPVAADVGGQAELVTPECGYLIPRGEGEVAAYVRALTELLRDPDRRREMAQRGRRRVVERFDLEQMADGMEAAIQRAQQLAAARTAAEPDEARARQIAERVVEARREAELAGIQWAQRGAYPVIGELRRLRERIWPIGSRRYEEYKRLRQGARGALETARGITRTRRARTIGLLAAAVVALAVTALVLGRGRARPVSPPQSRARARRRSGPR